MNYKNRIVDELLDLKLESFGATLIVGCKGCGKTTSAKQKANSVIEFQDEDKRDEYLLVAENAPSRLLIGAKPRLFDEWQDAPKLWGAVRKSVDDLQENGLYILTGSSAKKVKVPHSGTSRISRLKMYPMSLFESGESTGEISLRELFDHPENFRECTSRLSYDDLIFAICRGGWPRSLMNKTRRSQLEVAKDIFVQTYSVDASKIDEIERNPRVVQAIIHSYSRNICTLSNNKVIYQDVKASFDVSDKTIDDYVGALERLYIIDDFEGWCPAIRSRSAMRSGPKRNLVDPSIAVAALGLSPEYFNEDFKTLGFLFESLCIRDLKIYASAFDAYMSYYHDRYGLEADGVLHLSDGRYALLEFKLGISQIDEAASHLNKIEELIRQYNEKEKQVPLRLPDLKIILTASEYAYRREDGVFVIPIGCLKD